MSDDLDRFVLQYQVDVKDSIARLEALNNQVRKVPASNWSKPQRRPRAFAPRWRSIQNRTRCALSSGVIRFRSRVASCTACSVRKVSVTTRNPILSAEPRPWSRSGRGDTSQSSPDANESCIHSRKTSRRTNRPPLEQQQLQPKHHFPQPRVARHQKVRDERFGVVLRLPAGRG